ncbi:MAG: metal-dependent transcriptional regulator [Thermoplasmatota archaeon]
MMDNLTKRDKEYMRAVFLLNGAKNPVGPSQVAKRFGVSRVGVLRKMKRIADLGLGEYIEQAGLILNTEGKEIVEKDIQNHHLIENFLQESLDMDFKEACEESGKIGDIISENFINSIKEKLGDDISCECGLCLEPPYPPNKLKDCHWCRNLLNEGKEKEETS